MVESLCWLDQQWFAKVKNKKWMKCWKEVLITRVLSETTYEVQYVTSDGALGHKSIVHRNRLKGVHSQAQKDILAEAQQQQKAALSGLLGVSDEPEVDFAEDQQQSFNIRQPEGEDNTVAASMQSHNKVRGGRTEDRVATQASETGGVEGTLTPDADGSKARYYLGSDEEDDDEG